MVHGTDLKADAKALTQLDISASLFGDTTLHAAKAETVEYRRDIVKDERVQSHSLAGECLIRDISQRR